MSTMKSFAVVLSLILSMAPMTLSKRVTNTVEADALEVTSNTVEADALEVVNTESDHLEITSSNTTNVTSPKAAEFCYCTVAAKPVHGKPSQCTSPLKFDPTSPQTPFCKPKTVSGEKGCEPRVPFTAKPSPTNVACVPVKAGKCDISNTKSLIPMKPAPEAPKPAVSADSKPPVAKKGVAHPTTGCCYCTVAKAADKMQHKEKICTGTKTKDTKKQYCREGTSGTCELKSELYNDKKVLVACLEYTATC